MAMKLRNGKLIPQLRNTLKNQSGDKNEKMLVDKNIKVQAQISPSASNASSKQQLSIYDRWGMDGEISGRL